MAKTMTDQELERLKTERSDSSSRAIKANAFSASNERGEPTAGSIPWKLISATHPCYDAPYWEECRALYSGGKALLRNKELMGRIFPAHTAEDSNIYEERCKRAHYFPYPGAIIDSIAAGLGSDPITVLPSDPDDKDAKIGVWWTEFFEDVTRPGAERMSLSHIAISAVKEAMITEGVSWMLVDLPRTPNDGEDGAPTDKLAQERAGLLDPYVTPVPAENVIEWQETNGELDWITVCDTEARRDSIFTPRGMQTKTFTIWTKTDWTKYQITFNPSKPPKPDEQVLKVDEGKHPFGKVPMVRVVLSEGLRAMEKLESMAREHFNKRCALAWAEYKSLFALLYEFLGAEEGNATTPIGMAQEDPDRALSPKGQGHVNERGADDRAEYIGPPTAPFKEARDSCEQIKREMYRVTHSMADSVDMSSGAMRRSGESKEQDNRQKSALLREFGWYAREAVKGLMLLLQKVKGDEPHRIGGGDSFDSIDLQGKISEAVELINGVPMKSPTFLMLYLERIYALVLQGNITDRERDQIRAELQSMITMEDLMMLGDSFGAGPPNPAPPPRPAKDEDDDDDGDPPPTKKPKSQIAYRG